MGRAMGERRRGAEGEVAGRALRRGGARGAAHTLASRTHGAAEPHAHATDCAGGGGLTLTLTLTLTCRQLPKSITLAMMREHFGQFGEGVDECVLKQKQVTRGPVGFPAGGGGVGGGDG
eukprot:scaffold37705_cov74-Phaeocystis_antarctica.AAC.1